MGSCAATSFKTGCEDTFEHFCGLRYVTEPIVQTPDAGWVYTCWNAWRGKRCWFGVSIQPIVEDPSNDLRTSMSPRVRLYDVQLLSPSTSQLWLLNIRQEDTPIQPTDVLGQRLVAASGTPIRSRKHRFYGDCHAKGARPLPQDSSSPGLAPL